MSHKGRRQKLKSGDEQDAVTGWRHYLHWRPGIRKSIKRKLNKRARKEGRIVAIPDLTVSMRLLHE